MLFGAHCSTSGGIHTAFGRARLIGAESCQIFVKNNMQWRGRDYTLEELRLWRLERAKSNVGPMFGHTGYLINLAAPESPNRRQSLESLLLELHLATALELPFLVLHPGAHLGCGEEVGLRQVINALDQVFEETSGSPVRIALENTAGQGSCLGAKMEHLATIIDGVKQADRLGLCLDTAHLYAAGHDIRTEKGWEKVIKRVSSLTGHTRILAFHLNDSKTDLGSRVDHHAHIGKGTIGREAFTHIVNDSRFKNTPACLETPKSNDLHEDLMNLATLRSLCRAKAADNGGQSLRGTRGRG
jgi:deoxyribonuclease-4